MTNMTDGFADSSTSTNRDEVGKVSWSPDYQAERAWLDRCSPEYRAVLEQALHADVEALGGGFLDSWQETREQTRAAVDAFTDAQKRERGQVYVYGGEAEDKSDEFSRRMEEQDGAFRMTMERLAGESDEQKRRREDESIKRMVIPMDTKDVTIGREWTFIGGHGQWVDPCPSWDEIRPHGVRHGTPRDERLRARYEAGRAEHREDWTKWSVEHVTRMIQEEDDDGVIYRAMRKHIMGKLGLL